MRSPAYQPISPEQLAQEQVSVENELQRLLEKEKTLVTAARTPEQDAELVGISKQIAILRDRFVALQMAGAADVDADMGYPAAEEDEQAAAPVARPRHGVKRDRRQLPPQFFLSFKERIQDLIPSEKLRDAAFKNTLLQYLSNLEIRVFRTDPRLNLDKNNIVTLEPILEKLRELQRSLDRSCLREWCQREDKLATLIVQGQAHEAGLRSYRHAKVPEDQGIGLGEWGRRAVPAPDGEGKIADYAAGFDLAGSARSEEEQSGSVALTPEEIKKELGELHGLIDLLPDGDSAIHDVFKRIRVLQSMQAPHPKPLIHSSAPRAGDGLREGSRNPMARQLQELGRVPGLLPDSETEDDEEQAEAEIGNYLVMYNDLKTEADKQEFLENLQIGDRGAYEIVSARLRGSKPASRGAAASSSSSTASSLEALGGRRARAPSHVSATSESAMLAGDFDELDQVFGSGESGPTIYESGALQPRGQAFLSDLSGASSQAANLTSLFGAVPAAASQSSASSSSSSRASQSSANSGVSAVGSVPSERFNPH